MIRTVLKRFLLLFFSLLLTLLVLEIVFRSFDIGFQDPKVGNWKSRLLSKEDRVPGVRFQFKPYSRFYAEYDSNPDGYFNEKNRISYKFNNFGFRGEDYSMEKDPEVKRVVVLGDSFTLGDGVRLKDTYCLRLEEFLKRQIPRVEVLNFGMSGWDTADEIQYLRLMGVKFQPDLVVVAYVLNDAAIQLWPYDLMREEYERSLNHWMLEQSYLIAFLQDLFVRNRMSKKYTSDLLQSITTDQDEWDRSLGFLSEGRKIAESAGSRYMVFIFPFFFKLNDDYPFTPLHDLVRTHCEKHNIPVLDLFPSYRPYDHETLWAHATDQHPNAEAHRIAAEAIANFILRRKLL